MAQSIRTEQFTQADEVRELLNRTENRLPNLKGSREQVVEFLLDLDRIVELWCQVEALGADLRPEAGRWETIEALTHKGAPTIVREAGAAGGFAALRSRYHPDGQGEWWWFLDQEVRKNRIERARATALTLLGIALLGAAVILVLNWVIPTDPLYQASMSKQMAGQRMIEERRDYAAAIQAFDEATVLTPNEAEAWLWLGSAQKLAGDAVAAEQSFARARQILGNDLEFYIQRAQTFSIVGLLDEAGADVAAALAIDPEEPRALLYLAGILETQGQVGEAIKALEHASAASDKRNQPQLTAVIRYRLAFIYQRSQSQMFQSPAPTPTPH